MGHHRVGCTLLSLARSFKRLDAADPLTQCLAPRLARGFASPTRFPPQRTTIEEGIAAVSYPASGSEMRSDPHINPNVDPILYSTPKVLTTIHSWPAIEPIQYQWYSANQLDMPLRKDFLHRAVIYEADGSRLGTAWAPHRTEVKGSNRKIRPQKGLGRARVGDKKAPNLKGGGVAHGPRPRDFSTELQRKIYDKAWRIALSHRYRMGELLIIDDQFQLTEAQGPRFLESFFQRQTWGGKGGSMIVTRQVEENLEEAMKELGRYGKVKDQGDVDLKDLLSGGRLIIEKPVLDFLLSQHSSDL